MESNIFIGRAWGGVSEAQLDLPVNKSPNTKSEGFSHTQGLHSKKLYSILVRKIINFYHFNESQNRNSNPLFRN